MLDFKPKWVNYRQGVADGKSAAMEDAAAAVAAERDKWAKVLAESCDDFRSEMMGEAGSSGGCSRAVVAEGEVEGLRAALAEFSSLIGAAVDALDVLDRYEAENIAADKLRAAIERATKGRQRVSVALGS